MDIIDKKLLAINIFGRELRDKDAKFKQLRQDFESYSLYSLFLKIKCSKPK